LKLLQRSKIWRELRRLEQRAKESPSPTTFVDLGQVYINMGVTAEALRVADEGLALFPTSEELRKLRKFAKKSQVNGQIEDLRTRLAKAAHPKLYRELAALYLELGDYAAVEGTCEECVRRFPDDDGVHLILAKGRLATFYRDQSARDGLGAVSSLRRVVELDPGNAKAHRLLGEVLFRIGAASQALHHLELLREMVGDDPEILALHKEVASTAASAGEDNLEVLFHDVETTGVLAHPPLVRERPQQPIRVASEAGIHSIRDALTQIAEVAGVRKAAYIRGSKALVKGEIRDGKDTFLRTVRVVSKSAQRAARKMDIGSFSKGIVEGSFGHICLCCYGEVTAAVLCDPGTNTERVLADLQDLVAGSLYATEARGG
jgi:tetratricopeptide (TPR) repeat protein